MKMAAMRTSLVGATLGYSVCTIIGILCGDNYLKTYAVFVRQFSEK
jgi:hypothetical protein